MNQIRATFIGLFILVMGLSSCTFLDSFIKSGGSTERAKRYLEIALDARQDRQSDVFKDNLAKCREELEKSDISPVMLTDANLPEILDYLLTSPPAYHRKYSRDELARILAGDGTWKPGSSSWPLDEAAIRGELIDLLADWGEPAFRVDDILVRHVTYFFKFYTLQQAKITNAALSRGRKHMPYIIAAFDKYNLNEDIAFSLPFVETRFENLKSPVGAAGMFQIMPETAVDYGLKIAGGADDRDDPRKAAVVAARYLAGNRNVFASNVLALGSYHHGTIKVTQVLLEALNRDPDALERSFGPIFNNPRLGPHSKEYIPACLGAAIMYRWLQRNNLSTVPVYDVDVVKLASTKSVKSLEKNTPDLVGLNPDLAGVSKTYTYATGNGYYLVKRLGQPAASAKTGPLVTKGDVAVASRSLPSTTSASRSLTVWSPEPNAPDREKEWTRGALKSIRYVVQRGNTLEGLSRVFGVLEADIVKENFYLKERPPRPGEIVLITGLAPTTVRLGGGAELCGQPQRLITRPGDTLDRVARRAEDVIRTTCRKSSRPNAENLSPDLIYYWNRNVIGDLAGPGDVLEPGLSLTVFSDYL